MSWGIFWRSKISWKLKHLRPHHFFLAMVYSPVTCDLQHLSFSSDVGTSYYHQRWHLLALTKRGQTLLSSKTGMCKSQSCKKNSLIAVVKLEQIWSLIMDFSKSAFWNYLHLKVCLWAQLRLICLIIFKVSFVRFCLPPYAENYQPTHRKV